MSEANIKMMQTLDLNKARLDTLKGLYPDLFTFEGKLNPDELKKIVDPELMSETERFDFNWFGKSEAKRNAFTPSKATLIYDEERSVNPEFAAGNMIIEGENLESLKCLRSAYREKIKCIYIDPPYNTGKDFIYSDKWDENKEDYWRHIGVVNHEGIKLETNPESSGRYHSNWLNMMYPRLLLARQLLRDDGVIFVSIGDEEVHHLRKICDEIFGEESFEGHIHWRRRHNQPNDRTKMIGMVTEHILSYVKNQEQYKKSGVGKVNLTSKFSNPDNDPRGDWASKPWKVGSNQSGSRYIITNTDLKDGPQLDEEWMGDENTYKNLLADNRIVFSKGGRGLPRKKYFKFEREEEGQCATNWWSHKKVGHNQGANDEMTSLFGGVKNIFSNPKPSKLLKRLLQVANAKKNCIILDFFAGSGTTADAVMKLNREDGGNRQYILVQIPEAAEPDSEAYKAGYKTISDVTIERNKRVITEMENEKKTFKTGFRVYRLSKSSFPRVDFEPDPTKTEEANLALLEEYIDRKEMVLNVNYSKDDIFSEVLLKNGFMLDYSKEIESIFSENAIFRIKDNFKECLMCIDMEIHQDTLNKLRGFKDMLFICLEAGLDTTTKWNLQHLFGDKLVAI